MKTSLFFLMTLSIVFYTSSSYSQSIFDVDQLFPGLKSKLTQHHLNRTDEDTATSNEVLKPIRYAKYRAKLQLNVWKKIETPNTSEWEWETKPLCVAEGLVPVFDLKGTNEAISIGKQHDVEYCSFSYKGKTYTVFGTNILWNTETLLTYDYPEEIKANFSAFYLAFKKPETIEDNFQNYIYNIYATKDLNQKSFITNMKPEIEVVYKPDSDGNPNLKFYVNAIIDIEDGE